MPRRKGNAAIAWRDPAGIENASPEQRLLGAVIRLAVLDAQQGDDAAIDWLTNDLPAWLEFVTPVWMDIGVVHACVVGLVRRETA